MSHKFVADVGGTNIRLARVTETGVADIIKYMYNAHLYKNSFKR